MVALAPSHRVATIPLRSETSRSSYQEGSENHGVSDLLAELVHMLDPQRNPQTRPCFAKKKWVKDGKGPIN